MVDTKSLLLTPSIQKAARFFKSGAFGLIDFGFVGFATSRSLLFYHISAKCTAIFFRKTPPKTEFGELHIPKRERFSPIGQIGEHKIRKTGHTNAETEWKG